MTARRPSPVAGSWPVRFGTAALLADDDVIDGWLLEVDGIPQSFVHLADPTYLEFGYVQLIADVLDACTSAGTALTALHLGGGGCTLARYVAHTRPGSTQLVIEADDLLAEVVRRQLGTAGFRLRVGDAREALTGLQDDSSDVVISDVFTGAVLPAPCTTAEYVAQVTRVLRPGGVYVANIADGPPLRFARSQAATVAAAFPHVLVLAEPAVLRGRRFGNVVLAGSSRPFDQPVLARAAARAAGTARLLLDDEVRAFTGGAPVATDATVAASPTPPPALFARGAQFPP